MLLGSSLPVTSLFLVAYSAWLAAVVALAWLVVSPFVTLLPWGVMVPSCLSLLGPSSRLSFSASVARSVVFLWVMCSSMTWEWPFPWVMVRAWVALVSFFTLVVGALTYLAFFMLAALAVYLVFLVLGGLGPWFLYLFMRVVLVVIGQGCSNLWVLLVYTYFILLQWLIKLHLDSHVVLIDLLNFILKLGHKCLQLGQLDLVCRHDLHVLFGLLSNVLHQLVMDILVLS